MKSKKTKSATAVKVSKKAKTEEKIANGFEGDEKEKAESKSEVKPIENQNDASEEEIVPTDAKPEADNIDSSPETQDEEVKEEASAKKEESAEVKDESSENDAAGTSEKAAPRSQKEKADVTETQDKDMKEETSDETEESAEVKDASSEKDEASTSKKTAPKSQKGKADLTETQAEDKKEETSDKTEESVEVKDSSSEKDEASTSKKTAPRSRKGKADVTETQDEDMKEETSNKTEESAEIKDEAITSKKIAPRSRKGKADAAEKQDKEMKDEATAKTEESAEVKDASSENDEAGPSKKTAPRSRKRKADVAVTQDKDMKAAKAKKKESTEVKDDSSENDEAGPSKKIVPRSRKRKADVADKQESTSKTKAKKLKAVLEIPKLNSVGGKVFVVGDNAVGQLGLGEDITEKKRPALLDLPHSIVDIAAGGMHSVCLTESGEIMTFGCNDEGALGRPTTEEGSEYIPRKVDMPERIVQVSAGDSHSAALSESGQVYIWGNFRNNNGPMGLVTEGTKQVAPVKILDTIKVVKIASGSDHLSCLSEEGDVYTCGNGEVGQLGRVSEHASVDGGRKGRSLLLKPDKVSVKSKTCVIDNIWTGSFATFLSEKKNGSIYAFGLNNHSQLGVKNQNTIWRPKLIQSFGNKTWSHINGGQHHTLALEDNGLVFSLGRSEYGRLGLGKDCSETPTPTLLPTLEKEKCIDVSCGNCVSFAVSDNGMYSWGMGTNYQLGHGNDDDQHEPKLIEGNFHNSWKAFKISGGGQHTLILAHPKQAQKNVDEK